MEEIIKLDDNTLVKRVVVEQRIDIGDLEIEKRGIEEELSKVMTDEQLLAWAREKNPQPDTEKLNQRLLEINTLLEIK